MIKEIKYGGYTATPSDYECPDGDLAGVVNMVPEDGALRPLLPPSALFELPDGMRVLWIHQTADYKHYIIAEQGESAVYYRYLDDEDIKDLSKPVSKTDVADLLKPTGTPDYFYTSDEMPLDVNAVGNTLVFAMDDGVHYILWRSGSEYVHLGQKPPEIHMTFGLKSVLECWPKDVNQSTKADPAVCRGMTNRRDVPDMPFIGRSSAWVKPKPIMEAAGSTYDEFKEAYTYSIEHLSGENGEAGVSSLSNRWTNFALGQLNKFVAEHATSKGKFVHPFFVRWAYELYDGQLIMHSDPILLIPNNRPPFFAMNGTATKTNKEGFELEDADNQNVNFRFRGRTYGFVSDLKAHIHDSGTVLTALKDDWKDIVTRLNIYISAPLYNYKQDGRVWGWTNMDDSDSWDTYYTEGDYTFNQPGIHYGHHSIGQVFQTWNEASGSSVADRYYCVYEPDSTYGETGTFPLPSYILTIPEPNTEERTKAVCESGNFYKIASYAFDEDEVTEMATDPQIIEIEEGVLESLVARETMKDDYHSKDGVKGDHMFVYNGRVNLSGIVRTIHEPQQAIDAWAKDDTATIGDWTIAVELDNGSSRSVVVNTESAHGNAVPRYVFYPDVRAKTMWLGYQASGSSTFSKVYKMTLTEHEKLEGAYWFGGFGLTSSGYTELTASDFPDATDAVVKEPAKVYTSEVNNPFVFPLLGINTVGAGTILGICAATKALSQGQFGQFPLYAFTTEGVWALQATATGGYSAVQPVTRDVCINDKSITQTDTGVLFATDRGIMLISGSQTVCVSETLDGEVYDLSALPHYSSLLTEADVEESDLEYADFLTYIRGCRIIYDYLHQRYIVYNPEKTSQGARVYSYAYIYSLKDHKWSLMHCDLAWGINSYPEALAQTDDGMTVNLSEEKMPEGITGVRGLIVTRPLKLDPADALKTVDTIIQRGYFDYADTTRSVKPVRQVLYGSRDLFHWHQIWSSQDQYLRGFRGTPYKYFRLALLCDLKEGESLYGCTVRYEPRLTDQPR